MLWTYKQHVNLKSFMYIEPVKQIFLVHVLIEEEKTSIMTSSRFTGDFLQLLI